MKYIATVILIVLQCTWLFAGGVGTTGANYLKIGLGARATALGENFTALADDASAPYWNVAGLTSIKKTRLDFMQLSWVAGISAKSFFGVYPLSDSDYLGGYAFMLDTPQDKETRYADSPVIEYEETNKTFKSEAAVYNFSYARLLTDKIALGVGVKSIAENLAGEKETGFGVDAGILYRDIVPHATLGFSAQNIAGKKLRPDEDLPRVLAVGALYETELWNNRVNIVGDIKMPNDGALRYGAGAEYWVANVVAARVGYNSFSNISLGMGVAFKDLYADYAYVPLGDLGITHRIAVGYAFDIVQQKPIVPVPQPIDTQRSVEQVIDDSFVTPTTQTTSAVQVAMPSKNGSVAPVVAPMAVTEDIFAESSGTASEKTTPKASETKEPVSTTPASEIDF